MRFLSFQIVRRHDGEAYLRRLRLLDCPWFGIYLHRFLASDDACLHDHPWPFISIILWGGYWESVGKGWGCTWGNQWRFCDITRRWYWPGSVLCRRAGHAHRIEITDRHPAWTLVIRGPRKPPSNDWGFFTQFGWKWWRDYHFS
jgi:hypothetical protein